MIIRPTRPEDENEVVVIWRVCGLTTSYNDPSVDFRLAVAGPASSVLVAEAFEGEIVGTVMVGHDGHRGWLYYVATLPRGRRQGVGRALVGAGERWLRDREIAKVQLMVRETNAAVVPFYERLGFDETPRIVMAKWLTLSTD